MNAVPSRWRQLAVRLARHAAWVLPGARSPWADAMLRELHYIGDDPAALRWALGCVLASYRARLAHRPSFSVRGAWRYVATSGVLLLFIGLALQDHAGGQTQPPPPAVGETTCDRSQREAIDALRSQDRESFRRPTNADAKPITCRSDCSDLPAPQIPDVCKTSDNPSSR